METHIHEYVDLEADKIVRIDNPQYNGAAGDKTILSRKCECGAKRAFDYGSTEHMREVWKRFKAHQKATA